VPVRQLYEATLGERGYRPDAAQLRAIDALERCEDEWIAYKARRSNALAKLISRPAIPRGVYMYGGVGRGKSFLMDCFYNAVPLTARRGCTSTSSCARCTASCRSSRAR
jgi:cell division protein ZapE